MATSNTDWARPVATTIQNYLRTEEIAVLRAYKLGAMLESRGRVTTNTSGRGIVWNVQYRLHNLSANNGTTPRNFAPQNLWKQASLEMRGYQATDAIYKKELKENRGTEALVRVFERFMPRLMTSVREGFGLEYYVDGGATGNEDRLHGIESFMQIDSSGTNQTINYAHDTSGHTARTANDQDLVGYPQETDYAGLRTTLGYYGGAYNETAAAITPITTDPALAEATHWPGGHCDPEFDFFSPIVVNYTSSYFGGSDDTWREQCVSAIRYGLIHSNRNINAGGRVDMVLVDRVMYRQLLDKLDATQRVAVTNSTGLRSFGFTDVVEIDGCEVSAEYGIPAGVGYGFNINAMEMFSMNEGLFDSDGPEYDMDTQAYKVAVDFLGNLKFESPRRFFKLQSLA